MLHYYYCIIIIIIIIILVVLVVVLVVAVVVVAAAAAAAAAIAALEVDIVASFHPSVHHYYHDEKTHNVRDSTHYFDASFFLAFTVVSNFAVSLLIPGF